MFSFWFISMHLPCACMDYCWNQRKLLSQNSFYIVPNHINWQWFLTYITASWTFPKANTLGFYLVTATIFSSFRIQSKYNLGFPSKVGMSSIKESFAWSYWDWCVMCNACAVPPCILCWHCNMSIRELLIEITPCWNWSCCWKYCLCLCHLPSLE